MVKKNGFYKTTCSYCGVGCGINIEKSYNGKIKVTGDKLHPANKGMLCSKGMNLHHVVDDKSDRWLYPEMRLSKNLPRAKVSWDSALERTAAVFKTITQKYGPDSVGFYVSGQCLTEEYYIVNKLAKGFIGTNNIDTNSRLCMSSAVVGYKKALGEDSVPITYDDIELADCFFITGANPAWCHPIIFRRLEAHKEKNPNVKIIVADPRKTQTCELADIHLQLNPGTDVILNNALAKIIIDKGFADFSFIKNYTEGFDNLFGMLSNLDLQEASKTCGIELSIIEKAAEYIGNANGFISMWAMGLNQSSEGVNKNLSLLNLSIITGKIGKPGNGPFSLTGQPNAMGGREVGGMCNLLPAHRDLSNQEHRKEVADFWKVDSVPDKPGYTATEMFDAILEDKLKAIWIICTNPLVSLPNAKKYEEALKKARFVVVQDISKNSITSAYADVVLPAAGWLEKEGTMTNSDRRISYLPKIVDAPGEAIPDADILCKFAEKMGYDGFSYSNTEEIFIEHAALTKGTNLSIDGLDYAYLKSKGSVQWPFNKQLNKGTERLFTDFKFYTPTEKAQLHVTNSNIKEKPSYDFPLILTTGRIRDQWHTMTRTGKVNRLNRHIPDAYLEINPIDAQIKGIKNDDLAEIHNGNGRVRVKAIITNDIKQGVVFLPMHWGKHIQTDAPRANNLTSDRVDPISKEPDFKYSTVEVTKFSKQKQKIAIVGAGAAAFQFITSYRELNSEDDIVVFSKEKVPFYNRVQLPEYVNGDKEWKDLLKTDACELENLNIKMQVQNEIIYIDKKNKKLVDKQGVEHAYDILILATGSRANYPDNISQGKGIFTIRNKEDAERLMDRSKEFHNATIIGGGLLGLEMASALYDLGSNVSIVHRNRRLMDKQLDEIAGDLLSKIIESKGISVFYNDEVEDVSINHEANEDYKIELKSGKSITSQSIIYAIGTKPNIELAKEIGIHTRRGIVVNDYLETSEKNIFAIGEIAEFEGKLYGITAAAEEQAKIVAKYIAGDLSSYYRGSTSVNILKFPEIELCSIGEISKKDADYEEILFIDKSANYYKKCLVKNDRLVGAVLLGDKTEFTEFKKLIDSGMELSEMRLKLLRSNKPQKPMKGKLVCSCNNVGDGNIEDELSKGNTNFQQVCENTGAGLGCGSCKPEIKKIMDKTFESVT